MGLKSDGFWFLVISCNEALQTCGNVFVFHGCTVNIPLKSSDGVITDEICGCPGDVMSFLIVEMYDIERRISRLPKLS